MSSNKKNTSFSRDRSTEIRLLLLSPIIFIVTILPLIVRYYEYDPKLSSFSWFSNQVSAEDYFLYWKQQFFTITMIIMVCIIVIRTLLLKKKLAVQKIFIPLAVYLVMAILSTIFSKYTSFGFSGIFSQFENLWSIVGYGVVVYYIFLMVENEKDISVLITALLLGALLMALLGVGQAIGKDFWTTRTGQNIILPVEQRVNYTINPSFGEKRVYASLYNPNYVGVYVALLVPIFATLLLFNRKIVQGILYVLVLAGLLISMFGSQSKAGFIGMIAAVILLLILLYKTLLKRWYITLPVCLIAIIAFFGVNYFNDNIYLNTLKNAFTLTKTEKPNLTDIKTLEDRIEITYKENILKIQYFVETNIDFQLTDGDGNVVACVGGSDGLQLNVTDERFPGFVIEPVEFASGFYGFQVLIDGHNWIFAKDVYENDSSYYYFNIYGKFDKIVTHKPAFTGYESFATNRGFIWSHTLPLFKDYIFLGSGADTFSIVYPQRDYVNLYNYGYGDNFITKPHCLYLQIGVQTGVISLIAFLLFYLWYFISSIRLYIKHSFNTFLSQVGVGLLIGTFSYMVTGLTNDSSITTAPVFWMLLGTGIAVNHLVASKDKIQEVSKN